MNLAAHIDYTLLDPDAAPVRIDDLCATARVQGYAAVCVLPYHAARAVDRLADTGVRIASVVGFPTGDHDLPAKLAQVESLARAGIDEVDYVIHRPAAAAADWDTLEAEAQAMSQFCREAGLTLKMIVESGHRQAGELERLCQLAVWFSIDYVKTSTGTAAVGARLDDVRHLRQLLPPAVRIKASGGIRDAETASAFLQAGADRIGTSALLP